MPENNKIENNRASSKYESQEESKSKSNQIEIPSISLPKGGGAIKSIDEKFQVNAANGTAGFSVPFPFSPSRNSFMPGMALSYNSGSGNGTFGLGWNADPPSITRKTDRKLPEYNDVEESDTFIFSGAEDLVPALKKDESGNWVKDKSTDGLVTRYRPRIEGGFARIEKIKEASGNVYWKVTSKDNVISIFGKSKSAQIFNPKDNTKIFKWLLEFSCDDKGSCFQFKYKKEDAVNVPNDLHERNRLNDFSNFTNAYLKSIKYCNKTHFKRENLGLPDWGNFLTHNEYLLELVLDYGEHDPLNPQPGDEGGWICREDAFSEYRAGFEMRTYRLCKRVLMFHHFPELGDKPCLVRSMNFDYHAGAAFTFLKSITQKGYIRRTPDTYSERALPPVEFTYEQLGWNTEVKTLPKESLENLPVGIDDQSYQWIDLYSEGISGILTEQANGWYYKSNAGGGNFDPVKLVSPKPSFNGLSVGAVHFQDIEANGQKFLVSNDMNGYYEFTPEDEWLPFKNFNEVPNIDFRDANIKFLDLDGDGKADILITEDDVFAWYLSKGKEGFESHQKSRKTFDEERGPDIVFADSTQSIVLADMSGDGLMDIVRIRNRDVVYWSNLGYGRFGAKVSMSNAPKFDHPEHFNPKYIKLADLDGSGTTGIVYLAKDSFKIYFNQSGNSWSEENIVPGPNPLPFPKVDDHTNVNVIDLLGNGTGCIVWSSPLLKYATNPLRYIDLMGGKKPHIMISYKNNMGKEVNLYYKPSTWYYLEDKKAGNPWITKLPFPVQCVSQVEMIDQVRKSRFTNQYSYHHGYYDYNEREFRGFGRVDQTDTEDYENYKKHANPDGSMQIVDEGFHEPPVLTKTWFHTGAFIDKEKIFAQFAHEYYQNAAVSEKTLTKPALPADLNSDEWREALRACKGMPLHVEVYSIDGSNKQDHPYTTAGHTCLIKIVQPKLDNKNAVFMVLESEALTYTYERNPADPRIAHSMNIEVDDYGNVLKAAAVNYGRKTIDTDLTASEQAEQGRTYIIFTENNFTKKIDSGSDYRLPLPYEAKTYELTGLSPASDEYFTIGEIKGDFENAETLAYQNLPTPGIKEQRLIEQVCTLFLKNNLSEPLAIGEIESLALPYQSYKLTLTPDLVEYIYGDKVNGDLLLNDGKYFHFSDTNYWITSGTQTYDANNFYQVIEVADPFGYKTQISYDAVYHFFVQKTTDALENSSEILRFNFRTLSPYLVKDMNDNRAAVRVDELGMVMSTFLMGKEQENKGDLFDINSVEESVADRPGSGLEYDLSQYTTNGKPNFVKTTVNETHFFDIEPDKPFLSQTAYTYYCGGGNEVMKKVQAEPGKALQENEDGTVTEMDTTPNLRWVGTGRTLLNNKGKPVKQYGPYFSTTFEFEAATLLVERGPTMIIYYDSAGRVIKTDFPDDTFAKVEFDAWMQRSFDQNDTVLDQNGEVLKCKWYSDRVNNLLDEQFIVDGRDPAKEKEAAQKAAAHANTPTVTYLDSLGRNFLAVADNGTRGKYKTVSVTDIEGNLIKLIDARGNVVMQYKYDMLGNQLYSLSMDAGERWMVNDVMGKPMKTWDSRNHRFRFEYDKLHRPLKSYVATASTEINFGVVVYGDVDGEDAGNNKAFNLRGRVYQQLDAAGIVTNNQYDFKGNLLESSRQLCKEYRTDINWNTSPDLGDTFFSTIEYDALNRPVTITAPDNSIIAPSYNEANLLETIEVQLKGAAEKTVFVKDINYNEKGQRENIIYGNDTKTNYKYDKETFRLIQLTTNRKDETVPIQKLSYTYDPVGNITYIKDEAQQTIFYSNTIVEPSCDYVYDAIYQLIKATGREHIGQNQLPQDNWKDEYFTNLIHKGDGNAMRNYTQEYLYDEVGNFLQLVHAANGGSYTRTNTYQTENNQLINSSVGTNGNPTIFSYQHDEHGNINQMPHLTLMEWDFKDQLHCTQQTIMSNGTGEKTYYVYDGGGQRTRKVTEWQGSENKKEERIYLGGFEIYRRYKADGVTVELKRETLHIMDDKTKIALVETKTEENDSNDETELNKRYTRYQFTNHLGSACLELDEDAAIVSYEEYHPYGTTSYQAADKNINPIAKRYRYTGLERDEESGLEYHSARYYLPWLGRWLSTDPIGIVGGSNYYLYSGNSVSNLNDQNGKHPTSGKTKPPPIEPIREGMIIGDYPGLNTQWEAAEQYVLERTFGKGSLKANLEAYYAKLKQLPMGSNRQRNTQIHLARRLFCKVASRFSKILPKGSQIHHALKEGGLAQNPREAFNPSHLEIASGKAAVEGTTHRRAHRATELSEAGHQNPGVQATDEMVRARSRVVSPTPNSVEIVRTSEPTPTPTPEPALKPTEPIRSPSAEPTEGGYGTAIVLSAVIAFMQSDNPEEFAENFVFNLAATYVPVLAAVTAPDEGSAGFGAGLGLLITAAPEIGVPLALGLSAPTIGLTMGEGMAKAIEQDHPNCAKNDSCPNRFLGKR